MATSNLGYQSFYQAQLTSNIDDTELIIPLDTAPIPDEGFLVIESTVASKREIIYYTSKTSNSVTCPAGAGLGRGYDGTTAVSHLSGAAVIMAPVAAMFESLTDLFTTTPQGWTNQTPAISAVVANGNRSYTLTHASSIASVVSAGMRRRFTRTSAAPITSFSLNGTNMYLNKTSPAGMTFTDDFVCSAWVKLTSYAVAGSGIISRRDGTQGWQFNIESTGQVQLVGFNGALGNYSLVRSYQSIPLNKWVHIAAQLDMDTFTATTTTSYIMLDGKDVPASVIRAGTSPTALVQAGNLEIGSVQGGAAPFAGKIAQVAIYNAKVTQATILASIDRGLTGSETSLISAYSGANTTDLASTGNNLTAQNGAVSGYADAPFGNGGISSTLEYGLTMSVSSDGLTEVIQCPEGSCLPTTGGITASAYSSMANPYGWVGDKGRWNVESMHRTQTAQTSATISTFYNIGSAKLNVPIGAWELSLKQNYLFNGSLAGAWSAVTYLSTSSSSASDVTFGGNINAANSFQGQSPVHISNPINVATATDYYNVSAYSQNTGGGTVNLYSIDDQGSRIIRAKPSGL